MSQTQPSQRNPSTSTPDRYQFRTSNTRKESLEKYASIHIPFDEVSTNSISIILSDSADTATVKQPGTEADTKTAIITIPTRKVDQSTTDLPGRIFDREIQFAEVIHEVAHILYTDSDEVNRCRSNTSFQPSLEQYFFSLWNILEDGAIEEFLRLKKGEYVAKRLEIKNHNKIKHSNLEEDSIEDSEYDSLTDFKQNLNVLTAIRIALMDIAKCDSGTLQEIVHSTFNASEISNLDFIESNQSKNTDSQHGWAFADDTDREQFIELLPTLEQITQTVKSLGDAKLRTEYIFSSLESIHDYLLDEYDDPDSLKSQSQQTTQQEPDDDDIDTDYGKAQASNDDLSQNSQSELGQNQTETSTGNTSLEESQHQPDSTEKETSESPNENAQSQESNESSSSGSSPASSTSSESESEKSCGASGGSQQSLIESFQSTQPDTSQSESAGEEHTSGSNEPSKQSSATTGSGPTPTDNDNNDTPGTERSKSDNQPSENQQSKSNPETSTDKPTTEPEIDESYLKKQKQAIDTESIQYQQEQQEISKAVEKFNEALNSDSNTDQGSSAGSSDGKIGDLKIKQTGSTTYNPNQWKVAKNNYNQLTDILEERLQLERQDDWQREQYTGNPDPTRYYRLQTGTTNVLRQQNSGNSKRYSVILILDRSSSMSSIIDDAESAVGQFALGLETLDINVAIIDLYLNEPRLISPFNSPLKSNKEKLFTGETGGQTPLRKVLKISRNRLQLERRPNDVPFIICITDGKPSQPKAYLDQLDETPMPVLGISLAFDSISASTKHENQSSYYHHHEIVHSTSELQTSLKSLCEKIMF